MLSLINHTKYSLAPKVKSLSFRIDEEGKIEWGEFLDICSIADTEESISKIEEAKNFLRDFLAEGSKSHAEIKVASEQLNIAKRTLDKVKAELHIPSYKSQNQWFWRL